ncbi:DUF461 domain-containing protein [Streptomyces sp. NPDC059828]|uniref:DUF461 domain-containing protein n=1 Tax=Streptomyces sp. NPDC059828 TaxID=3346965 RepID=UPI003648AA43
MISVASLTACGAGNDAQTLEIKPDNAATSVGDIKIQNATVITQPDTKAEGPAVVSGTVFNNGTKEQTLESITLPGTKLTVKLTPAKGSGALTVPAGGSVLLGGKGNASAVIENGREAGQDGEPQKVVFRFSETGDVSIDAFVVPATSYFTEYGPSAIPQPPASPSAPAASPSAPAAGHGGEGEEAEPSSQDGAEDGAADGTEAGAEH